MIIRIRNRKDLYAGLMFLFFGFLTLTFSWTYPLGTAARMGPGYFPFILGCILASLGIIIAVHSLWMSGKEIEPCFPRPLVLITSAVLSFAVLVERFGLVLAVLGLVVISSLAEKGFRLRKVVVLFFVLAATGVGVFVYSLRLPFKVWPF
jgi:hypothetical protein